MVKSARVGTCGDHNLMVIKKMTCSTKVRNIHTLTINFTYI